MVGGGGGGGFACLHACALERGREGGKRGRGRGLIACEGGRGREIVS